MKAKFQFKLERKSGNRANILFKSFFSSLKGNQLT